MKTAQKSASTPGVSRLIDKIQKRLDVIEDLVGFMIRSNQRFRKGQRVRFSAKAIRSGITRGRGVDRRGTVVEVGNDWRMKVLLDGRKHPSWFHHSFFDRVGRNDGI